MTDRTSSYRSLPLLFRLIVNNDWKKLRKRLNSSKAYTLCQERDRSGLTCLALALAYMAPSDIIKTIINTDPSIIKVTDKYNANALHFSCLNGASIESIEMLINECEDAAREVDVDQRSPLHHAIEFLCSTTDFDSDVLDSKIKLLQLLCRVAPEMINHQDKDADTPTDLVQIVKAGAVLGSDQYRWLDRIYRVLRDTSINAYRENKRGWEAQLPEIRIALNVDTNSSTQAFASRHSVTASITTNSTICSAKQSLQSDSNKSHLVNLFQLGKKNGNKSNGRNLSPQSNHSNTLDTKRRKK